jgi:phosphatidylinositol alpha-mannosyltransferase
MRIGIVSEYVRPWPGGISEHVFHEAEELLRRGHHVSVVSGPARAAAAPVASGGELLRLPWSLEFVSNGARSRLSLGPQLLRLRGWLEAQCFDVLHVHAPLDPMLCLAAVLAAPCPVVGTFHASFAPGPLWDLLYRGLGLLTQAAFMRLATKIVVSEEARRSIAHYFPADYRQLPNGVDLTRFSPQVCALPEAEAEGPLVLFVGRADPRKGLPLLLQAFARVRSRQPALRLWLAGVSEHDLLQQRQATHGVRALGYVEPAMLPALYAAASLVCAPSTAGESQGLVLLEAMASGKPVVCFDIPGYRELLRHAETAWLSAERSAQALAQGLEAVLADPAFRARAQRIGPRVAAAYAWPEVARQLEGVFLGAREAQRSVRAIQS